MAFSNSQYADARYGRFTDIGHDQINFSQNLHINLYFSLWGSRQSSRRLLHESGNDQAGRVSRPRASPHGRVLAAPHNSSNVVSAADLAIGLIIQVVQLLIGRNESLQNHEELKLELKSLHKSLVWTRNATLEYQNRPLGRNLSATVIPEVERCYATLQELLDRVNDTWMGLDSTSIGELWRSVWWNRWDGDELASLRRRLSDNRRSLDGLLNALNSVAWTELGNELCSGRISLKQFHTSLERYLRSLPVRYIQISNVVVIDHLGKNIPVPIQFCSSWKDFHHIINGYCRNRFGHHLIERGDYKVTRDNQIINSSDFTTKVESGMMLEMSVVLHSKSRMDIKRKCPRCGHFNFKVVVNDGWMECFKCSGLFQVAEQIQDDTGLISPAVRKNTASRGNNEDSHSREDGKEFYRRIINITTSLLPPVLQLQIPDDPSVYLQPPAPGGHAAFLEYKYYEEYFLEHPIQRMRRDSD